LVLVEQSIDSRHVPFPRRDARRPLQGKYGTQDAGGYTVRQQSGELCLEILKFGTRVTAEPISQGAETLSDVRLALAAIEPWSTQAQAAEECPATVAGDP
jgi:hypothetical protein